MGLRSRIFSGDSRLPLASLFLEITEALALALVASAEVFLRLAGGAAFWTLATSVLEVAAAPSSALVTAGVARCIAIAAMPGFTAPAAAIGAASVTFSTAELAGAVTAS